MQSWNFIIARLVCLQNKACLHCVLKYSISILHPKINRWKLLCNNLYKKVIGYIVTPGASCNLCRGEIDPQRLDTLPWCRSKCWYGSPWSCWCSCWQFYKMYFFNIPFIHAFLLRFWCTNYLVIVRSSVANIIYNLKDKILPTCSNGQD